MKKILFLLALSVYLFACSDDEKSNKAELLNFNVTDLSIEEITLKDVEMNNEMNQIYVFIDNDLNNFEFPLTLSADFNISSGATIPDFPDGNIQFTNPDEVINIDIIAENGDMNTWYIFLIHHQVQNSGFDYWYDNLGMNGVYYKEIGQSNETSLWATANLGTSIYGKYGTQPLTEGTKQYVQIRTDSTKNLPLTAATLFIGRFNLAGATQNPTDPRKATIFGIPFKFKPTAMKFKYKFHAGEKYIQATVNDPSDIFGGFTVSEIDGEDQCSVFAYLETTNGDEIKELARAELSSGTTEDILTEVTVPFNYVSNEEPTQITIVFSSSKYGDLWKGSVGSTLVINDLELVYE